MHPSFQPNFYDIPIKDIFAKVRSELGIKGIIVLDFYHNNMPLWHKAPGLIGICEPYVNDNEIPSDYCD